MSNGGSSLFDCENVSAGYYFFHIPKTAGTSLYSVLESVFAEEEIAPPHLWHEVVAAGGAAFADYRLYRGHFYSALGQIVDAPLRSFVFLRNPIERALSHYGHVVRDEGHYLHARAVQLGSLEAYLRDPVARETVRNFQAKSLVMYFDPLSMADKMTKDELANFELEKLIETTPINLSDEELLERAKRSLDRFCCLGITERFGDSVWLLAKVFGWNLSSSFGVLNSNPARPASSRLGKTERELLEELNKVDVELYKYGLALFEEKLRQFRLSESGLNGGFVSYAQNYEDVMLWRALKHVEHGFYIDVGAAWPNEHSVTKAFYERAWHGINVEPNPEFNSQLCQCRPRDINLKLAVGEREGALTFNLLADTGLSTLDDGIAEKHQAAGWSTNRQEVEVTTLAALWRAHVPAGQAVHFLKVDVEGFEEAVLRGNDWQEYRPWIVVVEATLPLSQVESHEAWEPILLHAGYQFAYADGLNRFYVALEHPKLLPAFKYPPNVFDEFKLVGQQEAEFRATEAESRATEAEFRATEAESRAAEAESRAQEQEQRALAAETHNAEQTQRIDELESNLHHWRLQAYALETEGNALRQSWSWRVTAPVRSVVGVVIHAVPRLQNATNHLAHLGINALKRPLAMMMRVILRRPGLSYRLNQFLLRYPTIHQQLLGVARSQGVMTGVSTYVLPGPPSTMPETEAPGHLTPHARQIYRNLKAAIESRQKENG